jgi:hypothetical protein
MQVGNKASLFLKKYDGEPLFCGPSVMEMDSNFNVHMLCYQGTGTFALETVPVGTVWTMNPCFVLAAFI